MSAGWKAALAIILVLGLTVLGAGAWWFLDHYERVTEQEDRGFSGMARVNDWHGAALTLTELGLPTRSIQGLASLPGEGELLMVMTHSPLTGDRQAARLEQWVARGGHLVLVMPEEQMEAEDLELLPSIEELLVEDDLPGDGPTRDGPTQDSSSDLSWLFDELPDLEPLPEQSVEDTAPPPVAEVAEALSDTGSWTDEGGDTDTPQDIDELLNEPRGRPLGMYFLDRYEFQGPSGADRVRTLHLDAGRITLLVDPSIFSNTRLAEAPHAERLWELVGSEPLPAAGTVVYSDHPPSLGQLLLTRAWTVLISFGLLLLAWVATVTRRFGPLLPDPPRVRRSLLEHIEGAGHFLWRHEQDQVLVTAARGALMDRLAMVWPGCRQMPAPQLAALLAEESSLSIEEIKLALAGDAGHDPRDFTRIIQAIEHLRRTR